MMGKRPEKEGERVKVVLRSEGEGERVKVGLRPEGEGEEVTAEEAMVEKALRGGREEILK